MENSSFNLMKSRLFKCSSYWRNKVIEEIISTEKSFRNHLLLLIRYFYSPLKALNIISKYEVQLLFFNIYDILKFSDQLIVDMEKYSVSEAFRINLQKISVFSLYANNYNNSLKIFEILQRNEDFTSFVKHQESLSNLAGLKFHSLLITPVQRVPRYLLLLQNLLKSTKSNNTNYSVLSEIVNYITNSIEQLNDCIKIHETYNRMVILQQKYFADQSIILFTPGRYLIKEGNFSCITAQARSVEIKFLLFSDCIIMLKRNGKKARLFSLDNIMVEKVFNGLSSKVSESSIGDNLNSSTIEIQTSNCLNIFKKYKIPKQGMVIRLITRKKDYLFLLKNKINAIDWLMKIKNLQKSMVT